MRLFNTETKDYTELVPFSENEIKMYCCGFTAYDFAHIGNFRPYIWQDVLDETIRHHGYELTHVMNITDVGHLTSDSDTGEDKMTKAIKRVKGKVTTFDDAIEIARFYEDAFFQHSKLLHIRRPDIVCRATEHIQDMINWVDKLVKTGFAYIAENGNIYFDTSKAIRYGRLSHMDLESLKHGARVDIDNYKRNPTDFVIWFSKSKYEDQLLVWNTKFGVGYPGWHLECSVLASKYLGEHIDIHCGGVDHINVHHTNEIAQSEAYFGHKWVNIWMHGEFLNLDKQKMGKSLGNSINLPDLLEKGYSPEAYRHLILTSSYRKEMKFSYEALNASQLYVNKLNKKYKSLQEDISNDKEKTNIENCNIILKKFWDYLEDDLSTPRALAVMGLMLSNKELKSVDKLYIIKEMNTVLKLLQ